jgi:hypothetical protein
VIRLEINLSELSGNKLKADLKASRVNKSYHNKHKNGSGNFGFVIVYELEGLKDVGCGMKVPNEEWFQLSGDYDSNKKLYHLDFGTYARPINRIPIEYNYDRLKAYMEEFIKEYLKLKASGLDQSL